MYVLGSCEQFVNVVWETSIPLEDLSDFDSEPLSKIQGMQSCYI